MGAGREEISERKKRRRGRDDETDRDMSQDGEDETGRRVTGWDRTAWHGEGRDGTRREGRAGMGLSGVVLIRDELSTVNTWRGGT